MSELVQKHLIEKFLKQNFKGKGFVYNAKLSSDEETVEVYGYKGCLILTKDLGDVVEFKAGK